MIIIKATKTICIAVAQPWLKKRRLYKSWKSSLNGSNDGTIFAWSGNIGVSNSIHSGYKSLKCTKILQKQWIPPKSKPSKNFLWLRPCLEDSSMQCVLRQTMNGRQLSIALLLGVFILFWKVRKPKGVRGNWDETYSVTISLVSRPQTPMGGWRTSSTPSLPRRWMMFVKF